MSRSVGTGVGAYLSCAWACTCQDLGRWGELLNKLSYTTMEARITLTAPELEQFVVPEVQLTGNLIGAGAYGSVEEVEIPGARLAAKKLHPQLINFGSREQVCI